MSFLGGYELDYHYGSDFGDSSDDNEPDDDLLLSPDSESDSLDGDNENNDSDFSLSSFSNESNIHKKSNRLPSPDPLWLQPIELPPLNLPQSSDDLLVPKQYSLKTASIYEVFRRFKNLIRLTPFRLEDFCAALMSDEQSSLLAEIHIMILRALLREEDSQGTQFGPQDNKDSINISMYLIDQLTWPEVLRSYLESHESFDKESLNILALKDYPFVSVEDRISVLQFLTDQFLITTVVRDDLIREVPINYDDHCRICHKLGDLVCCETCPAVFHLECVDPPLENVPTGDYQCNLCKTQQIPGVYDCISSLEKQGFLCRHEHLGYDRHGRKYWFINRRIFIEDEESGEIWYYSSMSQYKLLISKLDENEMESNLCREIIDFSEEIERQMTITEALTNKHKGNKKSYLETENQQIADRIKKGKDESDTENVKETKISDRSEKKEDEKESGETEGNKSHEPEITENETLSPVVNKHVVSTRLKTGSLTPRNYNTDDLKRKPQSKDENESETRMTRLKNVNICSPFKLGQENSFKAYVNQYTTNVYALNRPQRNEDRDKKRPLSHKFSLTTASEFKWNGVLNGNRSSVLSTLRQTVISLEQMIAPPFMHTNWPALKKLWQQAISQCNKSTDFAKVLIILQICIKNCIFVNAWHEQLAHITLERITSVEREEKKKLEKREKRERDDEEERNRLAINFVKYPLGQKHQVFKQKGEEYRIHGQWSWVWMSYGRRQHSNKNCTGVRINPTQIVSKVVTNGAEKILLLDPLTFEYLQVHSDGQSSSDVPTEVSKTKIVPVTESFDRLDVSSALNAENRLFYPKIAKKSVLDDLLKRRSQLKSEEESRITRGTKSNVPEEPPANIIAKPKGRKLTEVEKLLRRMYGIKGSNTNPSSSNIDLNFVNEVAEKIVKTRDKFAQLNRFGKQYKCYSTCEANTNSYSLTETQKIVCYSPLCLQKARIKEELLIALKKSAVRGDAVKETIMSIVNRKPSILEQKLTEGKINSNPTHNSNMDNIIETNPIKLQRNFFSALAKGCIGNVDKDINKHIVISESKQIKQEDEEIDYKMETDVNEIEIPAETKKEDKVSIKMEVDQENHAESSSKFPASDVDVEDENTNENIDFTDKQSEGNDESLPERRSSRRSIKNRSSNSIPAKANARCSDNSEVQLMNSATKIKLKDASPSTLIGGIFETEHKRPLAHPNRRFNGMSRTVKRDDKSKVEKEIAPDGNERIYSTNSTQGKVYLAKISNTDHNPLKIVKTDATLPPLKYPPMNTFLSKKGVRSILVLPTYELRKLARCGGKLQVNGFNPCSKPNPQVWPYPCARPLFKTCWLYRTLNSRTLASVALQLRILWSCIRWDDMAIKPPTNNGKVVTNTDTGIVSTEILKHRICGRFSERIEYFRLTLVIPYGYADPQPSKGKIILTLFKLLILHPYKDRK